MNKKHTKVTWEIKETKTTKNQCCSKDRLLWATRVGFILVIGAYTVTPTIIWYTNTNHSSDLQVFNLFEVNDKNRDRILIEYWIKKNKKITKIVPVILETLISTSLWLNNTNTNRILLLSRQAPIEYLLSGMKYQVKY